jgi:hypothetical protein
MEIQGQKEIDAKTEPGIHGSSENGGGAGLVSDHEFRSSAIKTSGLAAAVNDRASSSSLTRRATGPRTPRGKDRSKHNALKHGIFSKMVLLRGESKSDFDSLLSGLRDNLRPEGMLEKILVEKLASLIWRYRRLLMAEGAEIRKGTEFFHLEETKRFEEEEVRVVNSEADRAGLFARISNPIILHRCVELLKTLEFSIQKTGFHSSSDIRMLSRVFGEFASSGGKHHIMHFYFLCSQDADLPEEEREKKGRPSPAECRANFVQDLKTKINALESYGETQLEFEKPKKKLDAISRNVPDSPQLDRLLRYEASLERAFDRTLNQLERTQRMRLGQPVVPPINLNISSS